MAADRPGLIRDIEILRAVAVLGVIFQHFPGNLFPHEALNSSAARALSGGWVGVDLFFAISGFVIARSFLPAALAQPADMPYRFIAMRFWVARLFRLAPSAWFWLLVILALCACYNRSGVFGTLETNLYWTLSGVLNYSNYLLVQYFGNTPPGASFVYWSLSLEEQFYLCFPPLVWLFGRRLAWVLLALVLVQLFNQRGLYGMMFRTDAIALGVLVALVANHRLVLWLGTIFVGWKARLAVLSLLLLLFGLGTLTQQQLPMQVGLVALTASTLVLLCSGQRDVLAGNSAASRCLLWVGQRSYAIYLIHIPAMFFLRETAYRTQIDMADHVVLGGLLALVLIAGLAAANYRWLETPLRLLGKTIAGRRFPDQRIIRENT